jgi:hypothetical protein
LRRYNANFARFLWIDARDLQNISTGRLIEKQAKSSGNANEGSHGNLMTAENETLSEKWRRFQVRPVEERALILRASIALPMTGIGLRIFGFRRWKELIERFSPLRCTPLTAQPGVQLEIAGRAVRAIRSAELHGPATPNCLERSVVLWWLLRRDGIAGELHIGARKTGSQFEAHAWVELAGQVLNDTLEVHKHYARFDAPIAVTEEANLRHPGGL